MTLNKLLNFSELFSLLIRPDPILKISNCTSPEFSLSQGFSVHPAAQQIASYGTKTQRIVQSLLMEASHTLKGSLTLTANTSISSPHLFSHPGLLVPRIFSNEFSIMQSLRMIRKKSLKVIGCKKMSPLPQFFHCRSLFPLWWFGFSWKSYGFVFCLFLFHHFFSWVIGWSHLLTYF